MSNGHPASLPESSLVTSVCKGELHFHPPRSVFALCAALIALGAGALLYGLRESPDRVLHNVLVLSYYLVSLGLAGIVFVSLQYVSGAGWSVGLRRVPEAMMFIIPVAAFGLAIVFLARPSLYPWAGSHAEASTPLRRAWFDQSFFVTRAVFYVACWLVFGLALVRNSRRQDQDCAIVHTRRNIRWSAAFLVVFAVTFWLASTDWVMSLEPDWSSTMFAVYQFAGLFLAGLAAIIMLAASLYWLGPFRQVLTREHMHDLGKLLFGFSIFWMYLWFFQYMLIWYTNNPEETAYFTRRLHGAWGPLFLLNIVLNWGIPFLVLLPKATKQRLGVLAAVSIVILAGRWLDLYIAILPYAGEPTPTSLLWEIGLLAGTGGVFALMFFAALRKAAIIPVGDPFLSESLAPHHSRAATFKPRAARAGVTTTG